MLYNDNIIITSVSEAVEKIHTNEKDYRKCSFMCFTLLYRYRFPGNQLADAREEGG